MKSVIGWKWFTVASLAAITALAGCQNQPTEESVDDATEELNEAPQAAPGAQDKSRDARPEPGDRKFDRGPRGEHRPGPAFLLRAALRELELTDAQKAAIQGEIDALEAAKPGRNDEAFEAHRKALADAVRAGDVDASKLAEDVAPPAEMHARVTKAIQTLHDTLDAKQRRALVDKMAARMEEHRGAMERHGRGGPDGAKDRGGPDGAKGRGFEKGGPMMFMLKGLDLTADQETRVKAALEGLAPSDADREAMKAAHEAHRKEMATRMEAFVADRFDAASFAPPADRFGKGPKEHMVKALAAIVPILTADQRAKLADTIEKGPMMGPMHHGKHGKRGPQNQKSR